MRFVLLSAVILLAGCAEFDLWHGFEFQEEGVTIAPTVKGGAGGFQVTIES